MAEYNAGVARAVYELDTAKAEQSLSRVNKSTLEYEAILKRVIALGKSGLPGQAGGAGVGGVSPAATASVQALTAAQARAILTTQKLATEQQKTARETANTAAAEDKAALSALRLSQAQGKAAQGGGKFAGFTPQGFNQALGAFGLATFGPQIVGKVIGEGVQAGQEALALRETRNSLKAVSGDAKTYATILDEARKQQLLFGGSLSDLTEGLSGFAVTARNTGAPLGQLIDLQKRLTLLNPAQGAQGGLIALNEALAGNISSLSRRFNIPKAALQELNDTTKPVTERLAVLDKFLAGVGITSEAVTGRVDADAQAFRRLGQELSDARIKGGDSLATTFAGTATGLSRIVGLINGNPQAIAELKAILGRTGEVTQTNIDDAARRVALAKTNEQLGGTAPGSQQRITGIAAPQNEGIHLVREQLTELNIAGGVAADQADRLTQAYKTGSITLDTYRAGLSALLQEQQDGGSVEDRRAAALDVFRGKMDTATAETFTFVAGLRASADASADDTAKKDAQQAATALLAEKNKLAVDQFFLLNPQIDASAAASKAAADGYTPQIQRLIVLGAAARDAQRDLAALNGAGGVSEGRSERDTPEALAQGRTAGIRAAQDRATAAEQARINLILQTGTATQIIAVRQKEYNDAVRQFGKDSAQAIDAQSALIQSQQSAAKAGRTAAGKGLSADSRADLRLIEDKQDRLKEVNRLLAEGHLTELARKQLLIEQADLETQISDEIDKRNRAAVDAALGINQDAQKRLKEAREAAGLQRELSSSRFSEAEKNVARLRLEEITLEQQKRQLDIGRDAKAAGLDPATQAQQQLNAATQQAAAQRASTPQLPIPNVAGLPIPPALNLSLTIELNPTTGQATVVNAPPNINILGVLIKSSPGA
jgi:hypothetical protein